MDKTLKKILGRIKKYLIELYGAKIIKVILYGSKATGKATKDSDVDVLVVVADGINHTQVRKSLSDLLWDILIENDELISVLVLPESCYNNYQSPFLQNVREEGVIV